MNQDWLQKIINTPELLEMGHGQTSKDNNLGMGWIYYALSRLYKPENVICIGSWRGFVPMMFAMGIKDNLSNGRVTFIDPSFVDNHWSDKSKVQSWFNNYDLNNIDHYMTTTQEFMNFDKYKELSKVDILFIDGMHTKEQAKFDYESFEHLLDNKSIVLLHDSMSNFKSIIYGEDKSYNYTVFEYVNILKERKDLQVIDLPFEFGLTLVRKI